MKRRVNLQNAAEAEIFGALALRGKNPRRNLKATAQEFTTAQSRALSDLARSLIQVARDAGAEQRRITVGDVSFELRESGLEEILSIRTGADT